MKKMLFVFMMLASVIALNAQTAKGSITSSAFDALKIIDYQIVESHNSKKLTAAVKVLMQQGWVPYGPVAVVFDPTITYQYTYVQTMVKY